MLAIRGCKSFQPRRLLSLVFGGSGRVEGLTMNVSLPLSLTLVCVGGLLAGPLTAQQPDADILKERLAEIRRQQEQLQAEEKKLREELDRLIESQNDRLLAEFTGTRQHDPKADLYKVVMKHAGRKDWEQTIWVWIKDDPRMERRLKTLVGKRVQVKGYLFQHDGKEFREGGGRIPTHALYTNNPD